MENLRPTLFRETPEEEWDYWHICMADDRLDAVINRGECVFGGFVFSSMIFGPTQVCFHDHREIAGIGRENEFEIHLDLINEVQRIPNRPIRLRSGLVVHRSQVECEITVFYRIPAKAALYPRQEEQVAA